MQLTGLPALAEQAHIVSWLMHQLSRPCLQGSEAVMALFNTAQGVSRVHAARRFFDLLQEHDIDIPVIHQRIFQSGSCQSCQT